MLKIALPLATAFAGCLASAAEQDPSASSPAAWGPAQATASAEESVRAIVATVRRQLADAAEPFGLLVMLRVKPGQIDPVHASYALQKAQADANSGNLLYHVSWNAADPEQIVASAGPGLTPSAATKPRLIRWPTSSASRPRSRTNARSPCCWTDNRGERRCDRLKNRSRSAVCAGAPFRRGLIGSTAAPLDLLLRCSRPVG